METKRALLAVVLSFMILVGWQLFFMPPPAEQVTTGEDETSRQSVQEGLQSGRQAGIGTEGGSPRKVYEEPAYAAREPVSESAGNTAKDVQIETSLYTAVISEDGGGIKSFNLKNYREHLDKNSRNQELIKTSLPKELPLFFSWGVEPERAGSPVYSADRYSITTSPADPHQTLSMSVNLPSGIEIVRTLKISDQEYKIQMTVDVINHSDQSYQGSPYVSLVNRPFSGEESKGGLLFEGPAAYFNGELKEIKIDDLEEGVVTLNGSLSWAAYEDTYFMSGLMPEQTAQKTVSFSLADKDKVSTLVTGPADVINPQGHMEYNYTVYFGPKRISQLKKTGNDLEKIINFGWFDILARPALFLLNFFHAYIGNYGIAIILVTIIIKAIFWPISHKGMKSMKTMQKIQPKMTKIREKYKDNKEKQNEEMLKLYQTYKVNPVGGCLPMLLQIPVFFALYKVLLQTIELRHAPFMLWINDLSAPDRLYLGFDIPYLGGLPVLTLLMGASMFLQQKMTPNTAANPEMQRVMMFMPLIFTVMFLNFASGLVLYWFVNNLLSMAQQYIINRQAD